MRKVLVAIAALTLAGCTGAPAPVATPKPIETEYDVSQIRAISTMSVPLGGVTFTVTSYVNDAYTCGAGNAPFPFLVVEQSSTEPKPLWVMLHGGGTGWYNEQGVYQGQESYNNAESPTSLLGMLGLYLLGDTVIAERVRSGDRVALGSLCDHDLYLGLGQPYPNNPHGGTVDGLLANLAMVDFVEHDRPTTQIYALGQSAGSYGAWALAHERWSRGLPIAGAVLDSGLLGERSFDLFEAGVGREFYEFDRNEMAAKHGPYFTNAALYAENVVAGGFDVPLFVADASGDPGCGGNSAPISATEGLPNCDWLYQPLADAVVGPGQQVHIYPGSAHIVTTMLGPVQSDLRAWLALTQ